MTQPNILLLFTDQQRFDTIAALGNPIIKTPALDRLVREGTSFQRCYTPSPVCVSARCATLTGLPPHKSGCVDNMPMPQDQPSFMERFAGTGLPDPRRGQDALLAHFAQTVGL
ncbi:MAG: sulfatase-like hydrolase/transferase [Caldilineaceae bacterium]